ncbi:mitochondrial 37S ribosomal protein mS38 [Apiospora kogelbergensis]|uniref:Small ribosomal subunit protein mS38 n=1 Tax=Apiospora kogelbergensis TaxID=1337665 RepID=A0AAW0RC31_9PEZI
MLPSSVRRVVAAAPSSPLLSNLVPSATRATAAASLAFPRTQQRRRYSSSKPSSPSDSPKGLPAGQVTASHAQATKTGSEKRGRRKAKDTTDAQGALPAVPSTQHVPKESLALSAFFGLHRPISVTQSFPKTINDDVFAQIFAPRSKGAKYNDVMSTLTRTVEELEQPMSGMTLNEQQESAMAGADTEGMQKIELRHPDGTESSFYIQLNAMAGQFVPFRPPPLPQPESAASAETGAENVVEPQEQHRVYKAVLTLEETTDANGEVRIVAHSPKLIEERTKPQPFISRMAVRQWRREEVRGRADKMMAISVRRQRKLRMKKKKYKKLMKRTRTERRKLDRT